MSLILCFAFALAGQAPAPPHKLKPPTHLSSSGDSRPVTCAEAAQVFKEARRIMSKGLEVSLAVKPRVNASGKAVSREQVVAEFNAVFLAIQPDFKFKPRLVAFNPGVLKISRAERAPLVRLIEYGCVGKVSPLATGPTDSLTPAELGDALGLFTSRIAELSHMPSAKWTPILMDQN